MPRSYLSPWTVRGLYLLAFVLVASPLIDLLTTVWPPRLGDLPWRYGFLGLAAGYLNTPLLGLVLAMAVAFHQAHTGMLRTLGVLATAAALLLLPVLATWPLDVSQMTELREADLQRGVLIGGFIQGFKYLGACAVLAALGVGAFGTASIQRGRLADGPGIVARSRG